MKSLGPALVCPALVFLALICLVLGACVDSTSQLRFPRLPEAASAAPLDFLLLTVANNPLQSVEAAGATPRGYSDSASYLVSAAAQRSVRALARDYQLKAVAAWPIAALGVHCVVFERPAGQSMQLLLDRLHADARVIVAQALQTFTTRADFNDPFAAMQSSLGALAISQAQQTSRGKGVRIALVDTGVNTTHPDLRGRVSYTQNFVDSDRQAFEADLHGTAMAGVIAAQVDNHIGIAGIAPAADLLALKACWQNAGAAHAVCNSFTLAQALAVAMNRGAKVVNLSLAGPSDPLLSQLIHWGSARGIVFVGATSESGRPEGFPSELPDVLAAAGSASDADTAGARVLHAPAEQILTLTPGGHYDFVSGNSVATANLSGVVALLLATHDIKVDPLRALLLRSSNPHSGFINACSALAALRSVATAQTCPGKSH